MGIKTIKHQNHQRNTRQIHYPHQKQAKCLQIHTTTLNTQIQHHQSLLQSSKGPHLKPYCQEAIMDKGQELMQVILIHKFRHTAPNKGEPTGQI
jgi:hypothetical protein